MQGFPSLEAGDDGGKTLPEVAPIAPIPTPSRAKRGAGEIANPPEVIPEVPFGDQEPDAKKGKVDAPMRSLEGPVKQSGDALEVKPQAAAPLENAEQLETRKARFGVPLIEWWMYIKYNCMLILLYRSPTIFVCVHDVSECRRNFEELPRRESCAG